MKFGIIFLTLVLVHGCSQNASNNPSQTDIFRQYLKISFPLEPNLFKDDSQVYVLLYTGMGCSYCNKKTINYFNQINLDNLYLISSRTKNHLDIYNFQNVIFDTINQNLPKINLRTNEGPVFLELNKDSVVDYLFITPDNIDSLFLAINRAE